MTNYIYDKLISELMDKYYKQKPNCIICNDPRVYDKYYNLAKQRGALFIFTYLSEEYGYFNVMYPNCKEKRYKSDDIYITKNSHLDNNVFHLEIDLYENSIEKDNIVIFDDNHKLKGTILEVNQNRLSVEIKGKIDNIMTYRKISKYHRVYKTGKPQQSDKLVNKYHFVLVKYLALMLRTIANWCLDIRDTEYRIKDYLWTLDSINYYKMDGLKCDEILLSYIRNHFHLSKHSDLTICFNKCDMSHTINRVILNKTSLINIVTDNVGYDIELMLPYRTDIVEGAFRKHTYPDCVMGNYPYKYDHCLLWSKKLLHGILSVDNPPEDIGLFAVSIFKKYFQHNIDKVLAETDNWNPPRVKPEPIRFSSSNEKHMYFIYQIVDIFNGKLDHVRFMDYTKDLYDEIEIDIDSYDELYQFNAREKGLGLSLCNFRLESYGINYKNQPDHRPLNNIIALVDLHRSSVFNEELNIYNRDMVTIKTQPLRPVAQLSVDYHPIYLSPVKYIPEGHTIWDTQIYNGVNNYDAIRKDLEKKYDIVISSLYIGDTLVDLQEKPIGVVEITPLINSDDIIVIPKVIAMS